ncbi:MAG: AraC family transcriptional regulator [Planctomycetota bacterium]
MSSLEFKTDGCIRYAVSPLLVLGSERRSLDDAGWVDEQVTGEHHVVAFSLAPVEVRFANRHPALLAPTAVAFARPRTTYFRSARCDRGQRTIFIGLDGTTAKDVYGDASRITAEAADSSAHVVPASATALAIAIQLERHLFDAKADRAESNIEPIVFEEYALQAALYSFHFYSESRQAVSNRSGGNEQRELVDGALDLICFQPEKKWALSELAGAVALSPAYLSRIFRVHTGRTLSQCLMLIRVARALEQLGDRRGELTALALECGFSSHSHMTAAFSKLLGLPPQQLIDVSTKSVREMMARLEDGWRIRKRGS